MANTLTNLIPTMYAALNKVARERQGMIRAVAVNSSGVDRAALNQSIRVPIAGTASLAANTPAVSAPDTGDTTDTSVEITISDSYHYPIRLNGEETQGLRNAGNFETLMQQKFEQGFRSLTNAVEDDLVGLYKYASRAHGTAGTAPFGTANDLTDAAGVLRILEDNGAPASDLKLVLSSGAIANLRGKQSVLFKVNEAGTDELLRRGTIGELQGMDLFHSSRFSLHTKGTGTLYVNDTTEAVDQVDVALITGSGTVLAGDVVTWTTDATSSKYVVTTGVAAPGTITIGAPGLRDALADAAELTIGDSYTPSLAFHRDAIQLVTRLPATVDGGDSAEDRMTVTDPFSGITFEVAYYKQYRQVHIEIALAWGYKVIKPEFMAILLG